MGAFTGWRHPYPARTVTGRQVISVDRPGKQIADAIEELQERAICAVVSENDNAEAKISGNTLFIDVHPGGSPSPMDFGVFCFGFTISGANVTIRAGEITWGLATHVVGETTVTITQDYQYVGLWATYEEAGIIDPSTNLSFFRSEKTIKRTWLYQFRLIGGVASRLRIGKPLGNWDIGSEFSP